MLPIQQQEEELLWAAGQLCGVTVDRHRELSQLKPLHLTHPGFRPGKLLRGQPTEGRGGPRPGLQNLGCGYEQSPVSADMPGPVHHPHLLC